MTKRPSRDVAAILEHIRTHDVEPGAVVQVLHETGCGFWSRRPCDCNPTIESGARIEKKYSGTASRYHRARALVADRRGGIVTLADAARCHALARELAAETPDEDRVAELGKALGIDVEGVR